MQWLAECKKFVIRFNKSLISFAHLWGGKITHAYIYIIIIIHDMVFCWLVGPAHHCYLHWSCLKPFISSSFNLIYQLSLSPPLLLLVPLTLCPEAHMSWSLPLPLYNRIQKDSVFFYAVHNLLIIHTVNLIYSLHVSPHIYLRSFQSILLSLSLSSRVHF